MAEFEIAYSKILSAEGGYINDPIDRGKETFCGISRKWHPDWEGWKFVDEIKESGGGEKEMLQSAPLFRLRRIFYKAEFWNEIKGDLIDDQNIANEVFDTAVNQGIDEAIEDLQRAFNLLNDNGREGFEDLKVDGVIGKKTLAAINSFKSKWAISLTVNGLQFSRYVMLTEKDKTQERFFKGWIRRVILLQP